MSSRMKSDQRVGMKVAGDGCRMEFARMKIEDESCRSDSCRSEGCSSGG